MRMVIQKIVLFQLVSFYSAYLYTLYFVSVR